MTDGEPEKRQNRAEHPGAHQAVPPCNDASAGATTTARAHHRASNTCSGINPGILRELHGIAAGLLRSMPALQLSVSTGRAARTRHESILADAQRDDLQGRIAIVLDQRIEFLKRLTFATAPLVEQILRHCVG
jgi:hypothetical protein